MLIRSFGRNRTASSGTTNYLIDPDHNALRNEIPPEVLRGDLMQTGEVMDGIVRKWKYTTGVISFVIEEPRTWEQQNKIMDCFEKLAFCRGCSLCISRFTLSSNVVIFWCKLAGRSSGSKEIFDTNSEIAAKLSSHLPILFRSQS